MRLRFRFSGIEFYGFPQLTAHFKFPTFIALIYGKMNSFSFTALLFPPKIVVAILLAPPPRFIHNSLFDILSLSVHSHQSSVSSRSLLAAGSQVIYSSPFTVHASQKI